MDLQTKNGTVSLVLDEQPQGRSQDVKQTKWGQRKSEKFWVTKKFDIFLS